ncbi:MAG TPA: sigma-70 family RNA polymerase sigma factor [Acidimicrobiales bacterium]|jgi:RNA polymerase sigma factor (sigma-70 family)|nr:sigma-70 family RNA polymerase sigma factor [Acidimicrobiales bacterium]
MARSRIEIAGDALEHQTDAELSARAAQGDREAFEELYRRHARTAMRVAYRVTGNIHDASDAVSDAFARVMQALPKGQLDDDARFRPYLMTATRHAAVDVLRRAGRAIPSDTSDEDNAPAQTAAGPHELLMDGVDSSLVAAAFRALPERWRSVLWLTEVQGIPAREAAGILGVSPNGVAQLAVRARAGLRERYLQAHLREVHGDCRKTVRQLGAYVGGGLAPRDVARVDQHLAACDACRDRQVELREIGSTLRRGAAPVGLAGAGIGPWLWRLAERAWRAMPWGDAAVSKTAPVGVAAASVLVAGLASLGVVGHPAHAPDAKVAARPPAAVKAAALQQAPAQQAAALPAALSPQQASVNAATPTAKKPAAPGLTTSTGAGQSAAPAPTTTTTAAPGPSASDDPAASHTDEPVIVLPTVPTTLPDLPGPITLPTLPVPTTIPDLTLPDLPVPPELPGLPGIDGLSAVGPAMAMHLQAMWGAVDASTFLLLLAESDAPLPSPDAAGLPV